MAIEIKVIDKDGKVSKSKKKIDVEVETLTSSNLHEYERYFNNYYRESTASCKGRSDVNISKRKMYKQKGTGNARRGANSSPLIRGGGVSFGPQAARYFGFFMNNKVIKKVVMTLFKNNENNLYVLNSSNNYEKTKDAKSLIDSLATEDGRKYVLLRTDEDENNLKAFQNLKNVKTYPVTFFSPEDFITSVVLLTESALNYVQGEFNAE